MNSSLKKVLYIGTEIVNKIVPFLALPIFANYLSKEEFGTVANFNVLFFIFSIIVGLSTEGYLSTKFYFSSRTKRSLITGNLIITATITLVVLLPILYLIRGVFFQYFNINYLFVFFCIIATYFNFIIRLYLIHCRFTENHVAFFISQFSVVALNIGLSVLAVIYLDDKLFARIASLSISYVAFGIVALFLLSKFSIFRYNKILSIKSLKFGIPLIPYQLAKWGRNGLDRLIITNVIGIAANGIYSYNFQISNIPSYIGNSLNLELTPKLYKALKKESGGNKIFKILLPYIVIISVAFVAYVLGIYILKDYIFVKQFKFDYIAFSLILCGSLFHSFALLLNNFFFFWEKNVMLTRVTVIASIGSVALNIWFTTIWGLYGTCLTFLIVEILIFVALLFLVIKEFDRRKQNNLKTNDLHIL